MREGGVEQDPVQAELQRGIARVGDPQAQPEARCVDGRVRGADVLPVRFRGSARPTVPAREGSCAGRGDPVLPAGPDRGQSGLRAGDGARPRSPCPRECRGRAGTAAGRSPTLPVTGPSNPRHRCAVRCGDTTSGRRPVPVPTRSADTSAERSRESSSGSGVSRRAAVRLVGSTVRSSSVSNTTGASPSTGRVWAWVPAGTSAGVGPVVPKVSCVAAGVAGSRVMPMRSRKAM